MKKLSLFICSLFLTLTVFGQKNEKVGVLVLAHGGDSLWNQTISNAAAPLKKDYVVNVAFGMANPHSMQQGINRLESQGVNTIVAVQLFVSSYSMIIRQNEYLLGFRDQLADPPMLMMMHHGSGGHGHGHGENPHAAKEKHHHSSKMENHHQMKKDADSTDKKLAPLKIKANILLTKPLNDNPYAVDILINRVKELSKKPKRETVILVAHGPNDKKDNYMWEATLQNIATQIKSAFGVHAFRNVTYLTLRDDASKDIYNKAKQHFREVVEKADLKNGRALIVPVLMSNGGIEKRLQKRLDGLDYVWKGHTLLPDDKITAFIQSSVQEALAHQEEALK